MSLQGYRVGPIDPRKKMPAEGMEVAFKLDHAKEGRQPTFLSKNRSGFSGGFKIPEEQRHARLGRKI